MKARSELQDVANAIGETRIAATTKQTLARAIGRVQGSVGDLASGVDHVFQVAPTDDKYYEGRKATALAEGATARDLATVYPEVRAVNIDAPHPEKDGQRTRGPAGWHPRVEVALTNGKGGSAREVFFTGDLTKDQAVRLATQLLQASDLLK